MKRLDSKLVYRLSLVILLLFNSCVPLAIGAAGGAAGGAVKSAQAAEEKRYGPANYTGTILSNVFYFPAKVLFAAGGAITSGVVFLGSLGDSSVSRPIWDASVYGDYLVTPAMMAGEDRVRFVGP